MNFILKLIKGFTISVTNNQHFFQFTPSHDNVLYNKRYSWKFLFCMLLTHFTSFCFTRWFLISKQKVILYWTELILESPYEIRLSLVYKHPYPHTCWNGEQNARKLPWQEQCFKIFNHSPLEQAVQFVLFSPKDKVNFILSDANGNTAQKLSMNSQFHRNLKVTKAIFPFRIIKTTDLSFFSLSI